MTPTIITLQSGITNDLSALKEAIEQLDCLITNTEHNKCDYRDIRNHAEIVESLAKAIAQSTSKLLDSL